MRADHSVVSPPLPETPESPSATPHGALEGGSVFPKLGVIGQLLAALHEHGLSSRLTREAIARYCDTTEKSGGEPYLKAIDLGSQVEELLNRAIEDAEARTLAKVRR